MVEEQRWLGQLELEDPRLPFEELLYARVDLIRDAAGQPRVLELELAEPSLFFYHVPAAAPGFVAAALERLAATAQR